MVFSEADASIDVTGRLPCIVSHIVRQTHPTYTPVDRIKLPQSPVSRVEPAAAHTHQKSVAATCKHNQRSLWHQRQHHQQQLIAPPLVERLYQPAEVGAEVQDHQAHQVQAQQVPRGIYEAQQLLPPPRQHHHV
jgi:hypothetical protein